MPVIKERNIQISIRDCNELLITWAGGNPAEKPSEIEIHQNIDCEN
jgi:hypothetical protein